MDSGDTLKPVGINGAILEDLRIIKTVNGSVLHMVKADSPLQPDFSLRFGEIYFSEILPGKVNAWKRHARQTQLFSVPVGRLKIVLYDGRQDSSTFCNLCELELGRPDNYRLLRIPPGVWYGFSSKMDLPSLICNCADMPHDPQECERRDFNDPSIPYDWSIEKVGE